jgi:hypothetical protein
MKRIQLNANDWEDLRHAKVVSATAAEAANLDLDDETLSAAIEEAQGLLGRNPTQKAFVILVIGGSVAAEKDDDEDDKDDEDEKSGEASGGKVREENERRRG